MPVPTLITDLSTTAASNFPSGGDSPANLDDVQRAHASFIAKLRDESATIATAQTLTNKTLTSPVLSNPSYSGATANGGTVTTIDINGGTVDGTAIGGTTPAAGTFTTLSATGALTTAGLKEDASGNLGLGVTPSAWITTNLKALSVVEGSLSFEAINAFTSLTQYAYQSTSNNTTGWLLKQTGVGPIQYQQRNGIGHVWRAAPGGAAGAQVAWTDHMTLDASGNLTPGADGTQSFGSTSLRWSQVWCTAGAFNTSDARLKTGVTLLSDTEKQAAAQFSREIGTFQWLDAVALKGPENARHHVGFTVQRAQEILASFGLDPWSYGFMGYDAWGDEFVEHPAIEAAAAVLDDEGNVTTPAIEAVAAWTEQTKVAGDAYAFRYDELNLFVAAGINHRLAALEAA